MDTLPSYSDAPFHAPADIVLDLPPPMSVNRTRKMDWSAKRDITAWTNVADAYVLAAKGRSASPLRMTKVKRFELTITLSEQHTKIDLDNGLKILIDYLRRIELIEDDSYRHMRRLTVCWGLAPMGTRITVRACA